MRPGHGVRRRGVHHEVADESTGVPGHGGGNRDFVAGNAGDQGTPGDVMRVEFAHPAIGQRAGVVGILPAKLGAERRDGIVPPALLRQRREEAGGEEVAVCVVEHPKRDTMIGCSVCS